MAAHVMGLGFLRSALLLQFRAASEIDNRVFGVPQRARPAKVIDPAHVIRHHESRCALTTTSIWSSALRASVPLLTMAAMPPQEGILSTNAQVSSSRARRLFVCAVTSSEKSLIA